MKSKIISIVIVISTLFSCKVAMTGQYETVDGYSQTKGFNLILNSDYTYYFKDTNSGRFSDGTYKIIDDKVIFSTVSYKKIKIVVEPLESNRIAKDSILIFLKDVYSYQAFRFNDSTLIFISDSTCVFYGDSCYLQRPKEMSYIQLYSARPDLISNRTIINSKDNMFRIINSTPLKAEEKYIPFNSEGNNCYEDNYEYLIKKENCICVDTMYIISNNLMQHGAVKYQKYGEVK